MEGIRQFLARSPGQVLKDLWKRIPRLIKITFCAAFALCLLVNLYKFTRFNIAHDSIWRFGTPAENLGSGRWFEMYSALITGYNSIPWLSGVMISLYSSITACLLVTLLGIKKIHNAVLTAAVMITFPTAVTIHAFLLVSDASYLAVLLTVLAVFLAVRFRFGFLFGAVPLAFALGIYQANLAMAAGLFVLLLILECLKPESEVKALFLKAVKWFGSLCAGFGLYYGILQLVFLLKPGTGLSNYKGMDQMGQINPAELPGQIATAYREFFAYYSQHKYFPFWFPGSNGVMQLLLGAIFLAALVILCVLVYQGRLWQGKLRLPLLGLFLLVFPLAVDSIYVMVPDVNAISGMTRYPMVVPYLLVVALADRLDVTIESVKNAVLKGACVLLCWFVLLAQGFVCYNYYILANEAYLQEDVAHMQARHFAAEVLRDIKAYPEYEPGMPVRTIGHYDMPEQLADVSVFFDGNPLSGYSSAEQLINFYLFGKYMAIYLGEDINYEKAENDAWVKANLAEVEAMPSYPAEGCIRVENGTLYIKYGEALPENHNDLRE